MVKILKNNPLVMPAVILAVLLYGGLFRVNCQNPYRAFFPQKDVCALKGTVISSPARVSGYKNSYRVKVKLNSVTAKNGAASSAGGVVEVFIPSSLYEIYSPGKLYSAWRGQKQTFFIENGAQVEFEILPKPVKECKTGGEKTEFHVTAIKNCVWEQGGLGLGAAALKVKKIRALSRLHFTRLMYAWGNAGGLVLALLSGSREYLDGKISEAFKNAGLSHILALSGMHLSLFSGLALFLGKKSVGKKFVPLFELVTILLFFWFAGKSPSLFRALLGSLCAITAAIFHIKIKSMLNVLAFCFLAHVSIFPADMFDIGFMLSYGALAGILCLNEAFSKPLSRLLPFKAGSSLGQSVSAQIFTAPVCLACFGIITPGGIIASSVVSPIATVFVYMALAFIALCLIFPFFAPICGGILGAFYAVLTKCVLLFAGIPKIKV